MPLFHMKTLGVDLKTIKSQDYSKVYKLWFSSRKVGIEPELSQATDYLKETYNKKMLQTININYISENKQQLNNVF